MNVIAYCLLPNHYHILLEQKSDYPVSRFLSGLFNPYVQRVNQIWGRKGPLFADRFKHVHVDREEYLVHLCRYIHLNPIQAGLVQNLEDWLYSNYLEWIGKRDGKIIDPDIIGTYFNSAQDYREFVMDLENDGKMEIQLSNYLID
jgi:hypothetical protein